MNTIGIISKLNLIIDEIFISEWTLSLDQDNNNFLLRPHSVLNTPFSFFNPFLYLLGHYHLSQEIGLEEHSMLPKLGTQLQKQ